MGDNISMGYRKNRGFTLVELVIIIAVLAILTGLLTPAYTKYVEKSRRAADMSNAKNISRIITMGIVDGSIEFKNEFHSSEYRNVICVTVDSSGTHCSASGTVSFNGKTWSDDPSSDYRRVTEYMQANGIGNEKLKCKYPQNDGWLFYTVLVYSDGKVRYASGNGTNDSNAYYNGKDGYMEKTAGYWYNAEPSNIEKAMQGTVGK